MQCLLLGGQSIAISFSEQLIFSSVDCVQSVPMHHPAKFCCNSLNVCIEMALKKKLSSFYLAAVRHPGFLEIQFFNC